jgi:hypothetical protein
MGRSWLILSGIDVSKLSIRIRRVQLLYLDAPLRRLAGPFGGNETIIDVIFVV